MCDGPEEEQQNSAKWPEYNATAKRVEGEEAGSDGDVGAKGSEEEAGDREKKERGARIGAASTQYSSSFFVGSSFLRIRTVRSYIRTTSLTETSGKKRASKSCLRSAP